MLLYSNYPETVFWRTFNIQDRSYAFGVREGLIRAGEAPLNYQHPSDQFTLELKRGGILGEFLQRPGEGFSNADQLCIQSNGRLERVQLQPDGGDQAQNQVSPPPPAAFEKRVPGFNVQHHGFKFSNSFPITAFPVQEVAGIRIKDNSFGLCGGMAYALRDYFETGLAISSRTEPPTGGRLFDYLWQRLIDSFNLPFGAGCPTRYLQLMNPSLPDAGPPGLGPAGRAWVMIREEWPKIRETIDAGRLCPIALILEKSTDISDIVDNHQVLVYGYKVQGNALTLFMYDPNHPGVETPLYLNLENPNAPATASDNTGRTIHCFMRTDYTYRRPPEDTAAGGPEWEPGWRSIGSGMVRSSADIASMRPDHLAVFAVRMDGKLWWSEINGPSWGNWDWMRDGVIFNPSAVSWADGRIDVFAVDSDHTMIHSSIQNGQRSQWDKLGGYLTSGPDVCSMAPGHLDVFVKGQDNALWHRWYIEGSGWSDWESLGGVLTSDPTAVSWGPNRIDVFALGADRRLYHIWFNGSWQAWEPVAGPVASGPDAASCGPGKLDVFATGFDGALKQLTFDERGWSGWKNLGGVLTSDPSTVSRAPGTIDVVARGADLGLWMKRYA